MEKRLDRRRKYYFVLDCETATMPYVSTLKAEDKKQICIAKPLIYDLGWKIIDAQGRVYCRKSFLISEIFSVPSVFNTAYYASKRPLYLEKIKNNEIQVVSWKEATAQMVADIEMTEAVGAYNAMFDFKKAISFTEEYITHLYSADFYEWEQKQIKNINYILSNPYRSEKKDFNPNVFEFRGKTYPLFDIWGLSCENLLDNDEFRKFCINFGRLTASGKYYSTTAETVYQFLKDDLEFIESHTAIEDADIECEILTEIFKKVKPKNMTMGIIYFPFRIVGKADEWE